MARPGESIAKQSEGRVGEKCLPVGGRVRKLRAVKIAIIRIRRRAGDRYSLSVKREVV
jgi:hypothetical protein